jgi:hypothetical protein
MVEGATERVSTNGFCMRFDVLTAVKISTVVFWIVTACVDL